MEFEHINLNSKLAKETLKQIKNKHKINEFHLNAIVSKCQVNLAKLNIVEAMEDDMHGKMIKKIEDELGMMSGFFIFMTKGKREMENEILLSLKAEIYVTE